MRNLGLGEHRTIGSFVWAKLRAFSEENADFAHFFELMFSEKENIMYEMSVGYRIVKTTYGEAKSMTLKRANALKNRLSSLEYDAVVGISMGNGPEWIETFWAVLASGFRPLLLNLRLDDVTLEKAIAASGAKAVISDGRSYSVETIASSELISSEEISPDLFGTEVLVMSSGTSESVKICAYSAEEFRHQVICSYGIIKNCRRLKKHYGGCLKQLTFLPFYHIFGLVAVYIWFAFFSRTFVHLSDMSPQTIVNTVKRHKVTHIFAVPLFWETVYAQAIKGIKARGEKTFAKFEKGMRISRAIGNLPVIGKLFSKTAFRELRENIFGESVQFMISGGSAISENVLEFFNAIGYHLANGYGMTEIGITSVELSKNKKLLNSGWVGKPFSGVEYKIEDGQLFVRGQVIAKYIIENGERRDRDGWFATRDLAEMKNGRYRILGRKDDLVISSSGENLNPCLIEPRFRIRGVTGVCLVGIGKTEPKRPVLIVGVNGYISDKSFAAVSDEISKILSELDLSSQIRNVYFTPEPLLRNDEFKLNRRRLASEVENGTLKQITARSVSENLSGDPLFDEIRAAVAVALNIDEETVGEDFDFFVDGGGSSFDYFAMISKLEEVFSVSFAGVRPLGKTKDLYEFVKASVNDVGVSV